MTSVLLLVDVQNIYYTTRQAYRRHFDYNAFWAQATRGRRVTRAIAYAIDRGDEKPELAGEPLGEERCEARLGERALVAPRKGEAAVVCEDCGAPASVSPQGEYVAYETGSRVARIALLDAEAELKGLKEMLLDKQQKISSLRRERIL